MAGTYWTIRPPGAQAPVAEEAVESELSSADVRARERLTRAVAVKLAEGFQIESQSDTQVALVKPPKRWLGVTMPGGARRAVVSLDTRGFPNVHMT